MDVLMKDLLQQIECPVCFEYMVPPITQCSSGHNICITCKPNMHHCPTCRNSFIETKNLAAELLSRNITHPCKYRKSGCNGEFLADCKDEHQLICRFGPHKCPFQILGKCNWEGPMPEMKKHILKCHKNSVLFVDEGKETTEIGDYLESTASGCWRQVVFTLENIFFCYSKIINNLHFECYMFVGSKEDTNNFKYTVTIKSRDGKQNVTSCLECPNYLDVIDGNFPNEKCAGFCLDFTKKCINEEGELPIEYEITHR